MITIDETFKKSIGNRLKELRKQKAYTVDTLVGKCNKLYIDIDEKTIRRYEKGEFIPKIDNLIAFSEIYGVSLDYLIFGNETSDDNSYRWKDNLKRLNRLIFSAAWLICSGVVKSVSPTFSPIICCPSSLNLAIFVISSTVFDGSMYLLYYRPVALET